MRSFSFELFFNLESYVMMKDPYFLLKIVEIIFFLLNLTVFIPLIVRKSFSFALNFLETTHYTVNMQHKMNMSIWKINMVEFNEKEYDRCHNMLKLVPFKWVKICHIVLPVYRVLFQIFYFVFRKQIHQME